MNRRERARQSRRRHAAGMDQPARWWNDAIKAANQSGQIDWSAVIKVNSGDIWNNPAIDVQYRVVGDAPLALTDGTS